MLNLYYSCVACQDWPCVCVCLPLATRRCVGFILSLCWCTQASTFFAKSWHFFHSPTLGHELCPRLAPLAYRICRVCALPHFMRYGKPTQRDIFKMLNQLRQSIICPTPGLGGRSHWHSLSKSLRRVLYITMWLGRLAVSFKFYFSNNFLYK